MKLMTLAVAVAATMALGHSAQARVRHSYHRHYNHQARRSSERVHWAGREHRGWRDYGSARADDGWRYAGDAKPSGAAMRYHGGYGARPSAWCGWEMRHLVSGDPGPSYNLARNWAHWGHAGQAGVGAVVVWPHHVGKIVGRENGEWVVESGNDGHALRTRPRSIAGAIAVRWS
jgi:hypothetical protein